MTQRATRDQATQGDPQLGTKRRALVKQTRAFADDRAHRPDNGETALPLDDLRCMSDLGLFTAALPAHEGGLALFEPDGHGTLLRLLAAIGGADLVLGRLYEGHVNALLLVEIFATATQRAQAAADARAGKLFGVWNTGSSDLMRLEPDNNGFRLLGVKTFASGASAVQRPIVTAEIQGGGWQMTLPRMDEPRVASTLRFNKDFWHPLGMEGSESYEVDFTGAHLASDDLIGSPGDFYRDPFFRGGAIRFAAVHAGAVIRLYTSFAEWLRDRGRGEDPYQVARLGETALLAREAAQWVERACAEAEQGLSLGAPKHAAERLVEFANAMRVAVERLATAMMQHVVAGVGAHGLLRPLGFSRLLRDLTMYLRQPAPDQTLAAIGRAALRNLDMRADGATYGLWSSEDPGASMPASYFDVVYATSEDPWAFETSEYEAAKYQVTLAALPRPHYQWALEVGCSIGVLTYQLAQRCGALLSVDVSEKALDRARQRCSDLAQVRFAKKQLPAEMPDGCFDLVVLSEVAYYWSRSDVELAATLLAERQPAGAHLLLVHFTEVVPDYPLTGDAVHELWLQRPEWRSLHSIREERYRLDLLERV